MRAMSDADKSNAYEGRIGIGAQATRSNGCCEQVMSEQTFFFFGSFFFVGRVDMVGGGC